ncbi:DUF3781 domain-containing protein [Sulfurimonas sp. MAG313]|nr:DUF3781 domain-containing protein [Sulfurimonas sp. MAG313]MDF1882067.1 DUF3781 domain-containing protein [Sulfurimonas sp. MAG313]
MNEALRLSLSNKFRNTQMGLIRIKKNLNITHLSNDELIIHLKKIILSTSLQNIETKGKNHYLKCLEYNAILTINSHTFTVITAKEIKN